MNIKITHSFSFAPIVSSEEVTLFIRDFFVEPYMNYFLRFQMKASSCHLAKYRNLEFKEFVKDITALFERGIVDYNSKYVKPLHIKLLQVKKNPFGITFVHNNHEVGEYLFYSLKICGDIVWLTIYDKSYSNIPVQISE